MNRVKITITIITTNKVHNVTQFSKFSKFSKFSFFYIFVAYHNKFLSSLVKWYSGSFLAIWFNRLLTTLYSAMVGLKSCTPSDLSPSSSGFSKDNWVSNCSLLLLSNSWSSIGVSSLYFISSGCKKKIINFWTLNEKKVD